MFQASRTLTAPTLSAALIRRRRPLLLGPPAGATALTIEATAEGDALATDWKQDLRFFLGCYAAGLVFFFIMLS